MKVKALHDFLEGEFTYPIDQASVIEQIGEIEIEAPDQRENEPISVIIGPVGGETYATSDELFDTILGNLSDDYIGRKFYDDRGGNPLEITSEPTDEADISF